MHVRRTLPVLLGFLAMASVAAAQAGQGKMPPPVGGQSREGARPAEPQSDPVIPVIRRAVQPTTQQMDRIVALLGRLREQQADAWRQSVRIVRGERKGGAPETDRTKLRNAKAVAEKRIEELNQKFLADVRTVLESAQYEAWDELAPNLVLTPPRGERGGPDPARGPGEGEMAPDFELKDLQGRSVTLSSLRGRPVVLEFGSYTCPIFRGKTRDIEALHREFGDAVTCVLVYTREAHPSDEGLRPENAREHIDVPRHTSFENRVECAKTCTAKMDLKVLVLVDGMDDKVTELYGGWPNRGYVIDGQGKIISKQNWIDPMRTREALDRLRRGETPRPSEGKHGR